MKLTDSQVRHVAKLARLAVTDAEVEVLAVQLTAILNAVNALSTVNTQGVAAMAGPPGETPPPRADVVSGELSHAQTFANAPQTTDGSFVIPKVIE